MNNKAVFFQGMNFLLFLFFSAIILIGLYAGLPLYTQQSLKATLEEQNKAVQSRELFQILAEEKDGISTAQKILLGEVESLQDSLKQIYGEKVQCRLKIDALEQEIKCLKITNPPDIVEILVPDYSGKIHTISLEVVK